MKEILGLTLIVAGVLAGVYAGLWWAFIGGIVDMINAAKAADVNAMAIALGVVKVLFAGLIGWVSAAILVFPGLALLKR